MNGVDLLLAREGNDAFDVEIGLNGTESLADLIGFVGLEAMEAEPVFAGIDGYRAQPQFGRRPHDADRNLTTVESEQFFHVLLILRAADFKGRRGAGVADWLGVRRGWRGFLRGF